MIAQVESARRVAGTLVDAVVGWVLANPDLTAIALAGVVGLVVAVVAIRRVRRWWRVRRDVRQSQSGHDRARDRAPPVSIGDEYTVGVQEFSHHHSGERHAVAKVEGFVVFVRDVPASLETAETIRISVLSFNRGKTSATATFLGRA
ncbi:RNA-binding protein [Halovivax cerinus]|uniref:RNA-binding protein n=1 Tax=Halovivax cerinus TaxID=1487865 RepID=A0ABD5NIK3_9EURY|nr:RNA-binding protein [Halovivax cerinus]